MKTFKNINYTERDYECTNYVACVASSAPDSNWEPCEDSILNGLSLLFSQAGVQYWGYL